VAGTEFACASDVMAELVALNPVKPTRSGKPLLAALHRKSDRLNPNTPAPVLAAVGDALRARR
jgi:hypothetical protein